MKSDSDMSAGEGTKFVRLKIFTLKDRLYFVEVVK